MESSKSSQLSSSLALGLRFLEAVNISGLVWTCLDLSGLVWTFLDLSGLVWTCLGAGGLTLTLRGIQIDGQISGQSVEISLKLWMHWNCFLPSNHFSALCGFPTLALRNCLTVYGKLYTVQCTLYRAQSKVYRVKCTVLSVQCTVYSVQSKVYSVKYAV